MLNGSEDRQIHALVSSVFVWYSLSSLLRKFTKYRKYRLPEGNRILFVHPETSISPTFVVLCSLRNYSLLSSLSFVHTELCSCSENVNYTLTLFCHFFIRLKANSSRQRNIPTSQEIHFSCNWFSRWKYSVRDFIRGTIENIKNVYAKLVILNFMQFAFL